MLFTSVFLLTISAFSLEVPDNVRQYMEAPGAITEDMALAGGPSLPAFQDFVSKNWRGILDNFNSVAPTDNQKCVVVVGCENLSDKEYLAFLQRIGDMYSSGVIDNKVIDTVLGPSEERAGFLAENAQNRIVLSFLEKVRARTPNGDPEKSFLDDALSGKAKLQADEYNGSGDQASPPFRTSSSANQNGTPFGTSSPLMRPNAGLMTQVFQSNSTWLFVAVGGIVVVVGWLLWKRRD